MHNAVNQTGQRYGDTFLRLTALTLLLSGAAIWESLHLLSLQNPEIWGHLRIGTWILQNEAWPHTGIFSQAANHPWRDFSWGYDALLASGYRLLGFRVIPGCLMGFRVALAVTAFFLAGGQRNFWSAVLLSGIAQYILAAPNIGPLEVSIIFFGIELLILLNAAKTVDRKILFILPVLFLFWASLDTGFVYGIGLYILFLMALALMQGFAGKWQWTSRVKIPVGTATVAGTLCVIASLATPYGYHAYPAFLTSQNSAVNVYLADYGAMRFHQPQDYVLLLLAMTAFVGLGVRRRGFDFFQTAALVGCMALAFHAQRDSWLLVLAATAVIGDIIGRSKELSSQRSLYLMPHGITALLASIVLVLIAFEIWVPRKRELLLDEVAKWYPARASAHIRQHGLPTPLFNSYAWGSFLVWYLPEYPVAIDGRRGLYPDDEAVNYFKVMKADMPYQEYPPLRFARTLLLDKTEVMAEALRELPGFQVAYEDEISLVLIQDHAENERGR
jgi:hypothetical protein